MTESTYRTPLYTDEQLAEYGLDRDTYRKMRSWMTRNCFDYSNSTVLAEACAEEFDESDTWLDCESHPVWELALEFDPDGF